ncbi:O-antigen ligase family protein [Colwellia sp. RE-S-Sl-9]
MNLLFGFRFLSDYMWNIKAFTIAFIPLTLILCAELHRQFYINNKGCIPSLSKVDFFLWGYICLISLSFFSYGGVGSVEIYVKILTVLIAFYLGKVTPLFNIKKIYLFYIPIYLIIILYLISGNGFQYWGSIVTFSGGYFYKTDLAIGLTLFTVFMLVSNLNVKLKLSFVFLNLVLIFLANSRMYLLLLPIITALYFYRRIIFLNTKRFFVMLPIIFSLIFLVFYSFNDILLNFGFLAVDFNDFFSGKNLQGRDLLWDNLLSSYSDFSLFNQLFGSGLVKDTELAFLTGYFESTNAHNTYIFNLISVGVFGSLFFFAFIITSFKRLLSLFEKYRDYPKLYDLLYLSVACTFLFFIAGFSATVISFLQLSWFYFFFMGVLYSVNFQKFNK